MPDETSLILLDTHIWLWLTTGVAKSISPKLRSLIEKLVPQKKVRLSAISVWEVGLLVAKKKISFHQSGVREWVFRNLKTSGVEIEPISSEAALESVLLPEGFHEDPADRILLATAINIGATLITHDKEILAYSKKHNFPALSL